MPMTTRFSSLNPVSTATAPSAMTSNRGGGGVGGPRRRRGGGRGCSGRGSLSNTGKTASSRSSSTRTAANANNGVRKSAREAPGYGSHITEVVIGDNVKYKRTLFQVHRSLIASKSEYFRAAFDWPITNTTASGSGAFSAITIGDLNGDHFAIFIQWLYTSDIYTKESSLSASGNLIRNVSQSEDAGNSEGSEWEILISLYILGDRLMATSFRNAVITAMIEKEVESNTMPSAAARVYANTASGSTLRRLMVDFHVHGYRDETLEVDVSAESGIDDAPKEFYQDVVMAMVAAGPALYKKKSSPWVEDPTMYHED